MKGFKVIRKDMTHNGFKYQRGLNVDTKPFNPEGSCVAGGLYFFTDLKDFPYCLGYGDYLWEVQVPEGAQYVKDPEGDKYRADKLILVKRHSLASKNIWKQIAKHAGAIYWAARNGHLDVVKVLIAYKAPVTERAITVAACSGHLDIVKVLLEYNAPVDESAIYYTAYEGHLDIVKVLLEYKAPVDEDALRVAADNGHLEVVKLLIEYNAPVNEWAIRDAATEEIREVLKDYMKQ